MSDTYSDQLYSNNLNSRKPYVSTGMITKPIDHFKSNDMKHNTFEVISSNDRQKRVNFTSKQNIKKQRHFLFLAQE